MIGDVIVRNICLGIFILLSFEQCSFAKSCDEMVKNDKYLQEFAQIVDSNKVRFKDNKLEIFAQKMPVIELVARILGISILFGGGALLPIVCDPKNETIAMICGVALVGGAGILGYQTINEIDERDSSKPFIVFDETGLYLNELRVLTWDSVSQVLIEKQLQSTGAGDSLQIYELKGLKFLDKYGNDLATIPLTTKLPVKLENLQKVAEHLLSAQKEG